MNRLKIYWIYCSLWERRYNNLSWRMRIITNNRLSFLTWSRRNSETFSKNFKIPIVGEKRFKNIQITDAWFLQYILYVNIIYYLLYITIIYLILWLYIVFLFTENIYLKKLLIKKRSLKFWKVHFCDDLKIYNWWFSRWTI